MRAAFQQHRQVGYVFAGSKPHLLRRMAEDPHAAFYRFGRRLELGPIPAEAWFNYLGPRFGKGRIEVSADALRRIVTLTEGIPYYVMRVCRLLWPRGLRSQTIDVQDVAAAFAEIVDEAGEIFAPTWEEFTLAQRWTAAALAEGRGNEIFAEAVRKDYELSAPSSVARSLERLRDLGLVDHEGPTTAGARYRIVDPGLRRVGAASASERLDGFRCRWRGDLGSGRGVSAAAYAPPEEMKRANPRRDPLSKN